MIIRPEQYTMADMFKHSGYVTGAVVGSIEKLWNTDLKTFAVACVRTLS